MALLFLDSYDHYDDAADKYTDGSLYNTITVNGRNGKGLLNPDFTLGLPNIASPKAFMGAAVYPTFFGGVTIFALGFGSTTDILTLKVGNLGQLYVTRFDTGLPVLVTSPVDTIKLNQWYYIEWAVTMADAATGRVEVFVDGASVAVVELVQTFSSLSTLSGYGWEGIRGGGNGVALTFDDFYVCDGSGAAPWNTNLGDIQIDVLRPNGAGFLTEWTPSPAVANYLNVDDTIPDDDTTYNSAATVGLRDLFEMQNVLTGDQILGVQLLVSGRRTEEGFANLQGLLRQDGVIYTGADRALSPSYFYRNRDIYMLAPDGSAWTDAKLNAIQAGYKRTL